MKQLIPIGENIIVKLDEKQDKKVGGIIIPKHLTEPPLMGTIISVGFRLNKDMEREYITSVKPGNRVLIGMYSGVEFTYEDVEYRYMKENEIIAKLIEADDDIDVINSLVKKINKHFKLSEKEYEILKTIANFKKSPYEYLSRENK